MARLERHPVIEVMIGNAVLLSVLYLAAGLALEILLRFYDVHWVEQASIVLDSLPARVLHELGVLGPLTEAYAVRGTVSGFWLRAVFGATTVAIIFLLAGVVAAGMALVGWLFRRRRG